MLFKMALIGLVMSPLFAFADSGESKSFVFQGQRQERLVLRGELSHTEYRTEYYEGTCYNREFSHYETRCRTVSERVCDFYTEQLVPGPSNPKPGGPGGDPGRPDPYEPRPDPGPSCRTEYREECHEEPIYRDVPYSCTKSRQIPFTVKDGDALNNVQINFGEIPAGLVLQDTVTVQSSGANISMNVQSNGQALYKITQQQSKSGTANLIETNTVIDVAILSVNAVNSAVTNGMTDLTLSSTGISFVIGKVHLPEFLLANLKIKKSVFLGSKTLFDGDLQPDQMTLTDLGEKTKVEIKAETLGLDLTNKTLKITAKVRLNVPANIAKPGSVSTLQPEQSIKQKIKQK